jgi:hypothetical protein
MGKDIGKPNVAFDRALCIPVLPDFLRKYTGTKVNLQEFQ